MAEPEVPSTARYLARYGVLMLAVALATFGLLGWAGSYFDVEGFWLYNNGWRPTPLHFLVVGMALIPPAMWGVFVLEGARLQAGRSAPAEATAGAVPEQT